MIHSFRCTEREEWCQAPESSNVKLNFIFYRPLPFTVLIFLLTSSQKLRTNDACCCQNQNVFLFCNWCFAVEKSFLIYKKHSFMVAILILLDALFLNAKNG